MADTNSPAAAPAAASPAAAAAAAASPADAASPAPVAVAGGIEIDPHHNNNDNTDADSSLGEEGPLSTASVNSTIWEYRKLNGRTYHNFGGGQAEYWGPNDEVQNEQLDIYHHLLNLGLENKLFLAPLDPATTKRVLDVGTGTGIWAIDFADEFPNADVVGIDLSPIQPSWVPPNCRFELDDASQPWTFPDNHFDYVHIRYMTGSFKDWVAVYREAYRCLKPGGWFEHLDFSTTLGCDDGTIPADNIFVEWKKIFHEVGEKMGQTFEVIDDDRYLDWIAEAGFPRDQIQSKTFKTPVGDWPKDPRLKEMGQFNKLGLELGLEGFASFALTMGLGWQIEETQVFLAKVRSAIRNKNYHGYGIWGCAWVQKPLE